MGEEGHKGWKNLMLGKKGLRGIRRGDELLSVNGKCQFQLMCQESFCFFWGVGNFEFSIYLLSFWSFWSSKVSVENFPAFAIYRS